MREFEIYSLGEPPAFSLSLSDPAYRTERLAYLVDYNLWRAAQQGMTISQPEAGDETDIADGAEAILSNLGTFFDAVIAADGAGEGADEMPSIPDVLPVVLEFLPLILSAGFNPGGLFVLFVAVGLGVVTAWIKSKGNQEGKQFDNSTSNEELVAVIEKIFDELQMLNNREECVKLSDETIILWKSRVLRSIG